LYTICTAIPDAVAAIDVARRRGGMPVAVSGSTVGFSSWLAI
jgi:hypothetical protein